MIQSRGNSAASRMSTELAIVRREIVALEAASTAIDAVATVGEAKSIADRAAALKVFASKQQWSHAEKSRIGGIEVAAHARVGELLATGEKATGTKGARGTGATAKRGRDSRPRLNGAPTLENQGLTKDQSSVAQKAAAIPEADRNTYIEETVAEGKIPSVTGLVRTTTKKRRKKTPRKKKRVMPTSPLGHVELKRDDPESAARVLISHFGSTFACSLARQILSILGDHPCP